MSSIQKIIAFVITIGLILIGIFSFGLYPKGDPAPVETSQSTSQNDSGVKVVSTNLSDGDVSVISPTQSLEISFNKSMVTDNTRISIDPTVGYRTELSSDHKTIKVIPDKPFDLGKDYTLTIKSGYATDSGEKLDTDQVFHFKTVSYNGV